MSWPIKQSWKLQKAFVPNCSRYQIAILRNLPFAASNTLTRMLRLSNQAISLLKRYGNQINAEFACLFQEPYYKNPDMERFAKVYLPEEMIREIDAITQMYQREMMKFTGMVQSKMAEGWLKIVDDGYLISLASNCDSSSEGSDDDDFFISSRERFLPSPDRL